jgi:predicted transcriptional regulator
MKTNATNIFETLEEEFTLLEKIILVLLYLNRYNQKIDKLRLTKMIFLISYDIKELGEELDFKIYKTEIYDQNINDILDGLKQDGFIKIKNKYIMLTEKGIEEAEKFFKEFSESEIDILEEVLDLFDGTTDDEILAVFYFKVPGFSELSGPLPKIIKNRKKLAISLYRKGKISIGAASEIAGMNIKDFMEMLKKKNLI